LQKSKVQDIEKGRAIADPALDMVNIKIRNLNKIPNPFDIAFFQ